MILKLRECDLSKTAKRLSTRFAKSQAFRKEIKGYLCLKLWKHIVTYLRKVLLAKNNCTSRYLLVENLDLRLVGSY